MRRLINRSRLVILGAGALSVGTVAGLLSTNDTLLGPGPAPTPEAGTHLGGAPVYSGARVVSLPTARFAGAIDRTSRAAVAAAYKSRYASNISVPTTWSGSVATCNPGSAASGSHAATLESLNFVRSLAGLEPVTFGSTLNAQAQRAALIMSANQSLSHTPPTSWMCWSAAGASSAAKSNLALSLPNIASGQLIDLYMKDPGSNNIAVGHRRWLLNPFAATMGNGSTSTSNAIQVIGKFDYRNANPKYVPWPTPGWFPSPMEPDRRWSISAGDNRTDFSRARISITTTTGRRVGVTKYPIHNGYAQPTLVFSPSEARPGTSYRVVVRGIRKAGVLTKHAYTVRLFTP